MDIGYSQIIGLLQNPLIIVFLLWELAWKMIASWKAARQNQLYWFIAIIILNTVGIVPIIYILFFQKDKLTKRK